MKSTFYGFLLACLLGALVFAGWLAHSGTLYKAGDAIGYNFGLIGGLMMLVLLSYPMRKHFAFMRRWGEMRYWFAFHMACGIIGPLLIIFHSTFHMRSTNATVAFLSMVTVASSGFIGRYAYSRIHRGMYGNKNTLESLKAELLGREDLAEAKLREYPEVIAILRKFYSFATNQNISPPLKFMKNLFLPIFRDRAIAKSKKKLPQFSPEGRALSILVEDYIYSVDRFVRFAVYEKIFALWHVLHIPLVYLLALTAVWHVVAVHMY